MSDPKPSPCPDCIAEEHEYQVSIGGRPGGTMREVIHDASCPTLRGIV